MQYINTGNQFQREMGIIFNRDILSNFTSVPSVIDKENLVYEYINKLGACIQQQMGYVANGNPSGLYADYSNFKNHFAKYWRRSLGLARADEQQFEDILDEAVISQEQSMNLNITAIYFENGNALTTEDCLSAIYDVLAIS